MTVDPGDTRVTYLISRCHTVLGLGLGTQAWSTGAVSRMGIKPALVCKHRHNHQSSANRISKAWTLCDHYTQRYLHGSLGRTKKKQSSPPRRANLCCPSISFILCQLPSNTERKSLKLWIQDQYSSATAPLWMLFQGPQRKQTQINCSWTQCSFPISIIKAAGYKWHTHTHIPHPTYIQMYMICLDEASF